MGIVWYRDRKKTNGSIFIGIGCNNQHQGSDCNYIPKDDDIMKEDQHYFGHIVIRMNGNLK